MQPGRKGGGKRASQKRLGLGFLSAFGESSIFPAALSYALQRRRSSKLNVRGEPLSKRFRSRRSDLLRNAKRRGFFLRRGNVRARARARLRRAS